MSLFICDDCHTIENTALSFVWMARHRGEPALCAWCQDADTGEKPGRGHDRFGRFRITKANMRKYGPRFGGGPGMPQDIKTQGYKDICKGIPPRVTFESPAIPATGEEAE